MKCPFRFSIIQVINDTNIDAENEHYYTRVFGENQAYVDCYKEECMAYDKKKHRCMQIKKK